MIIAFWSVFIFYCFIGSSFLSPFSAVSDSYTPLGTVSLPSLFEELQVKDIGEGLDSTSIKSMCSEVNRVDLS